MMKMAVNNLAYIVLLAMAVSLASASDPSPLQDYCVPLNDSKAVGTLLSMLSISLVFLSICDILMFQRLY